ncbi:iron permease FTR1 [Meira miltonrushii]|uniref:Iron permease FTR1 n=1 Tax=Meira miltonrushii TaxID=1280837 RepID=A0A316V2L6_9BASI|nr:iron permease FTR1 [Meira miltonrushii]PWN31799.1 iron permease FTR1 [Meira miltonrushii]
MSATTGNKVFAPAIFFIAFREALEASLVIGILTGTLENVVGVKNGDQNGRALVKKLRKYIFMGAGIGLLIAFAIGAAFLAVFYTQTTDLYGRSEELWEGIFNLIAVLLITPMSLAILRADRSRRKWRKKLSKAFDGYQQERRDLANAGEEANDVITPATEEPTHVLNDSTANAPQTTKAPQGRVEALWSAIKRPFSGEARGATAIFVIPLITTLREGLEGVVFIGGVSLGLPATSIPLPAILGLFCGLLCGFIVFKAGSFNKIRFFLVFSTCFLLVIAAGMFSRSVYYLQFYQYVQLVGDAAAESGSGPGSYNANNYVWHLDCCNPEDKKNGGSGWAILNSLFGWNNTATVGSILSYIFYWLAVISYLVYSHFQQQQRQEQSLNKNAAPSEGSQIEERVSEKSV